MAFEWKRADESAQRPENFLFALSVMIVQLTLICCFAHVPRSNHKLLTH